MKTAAAKPVHKHTRAHIIFFIVIIFRIFFYGFITFYAINIVYIGAIVIDGINNILLYELHCFAYLLACKQCIYIQARNQSANTTESTVNVLHK